MQINWSKAISSPFHLSIFLSSMTNLEQEGMEALHLFFLLKKII